MRDGQLHEVEAVVAHEASHERIVEPLVGRQRDPADLLLTQARLESADVARREARQIDDPRACDVRFHESPEFVCRARRRDLPAAALQMRDQRFVGRARDVQQLSLDAAHRGARRAAGFVACRWENARRRRGPSGRHGGALLRHRERQMRSRCRDGSHTVQMR
ncbi:hypothetical protein OKW30_000960 [Paraburkholderia sp. Clong3]